MLNQSFNEAILDAILTHLGLFICVYDCQEAEIVLINQTGLTTFLVKDLAEFKEKYGHEIRKTPLSVEAEAAMMQTIDEQGYWSEEMECQLYNGQCFWALLNINTFVYQEKKYLVSRIVNLSKLLQFEAEQGITGRPYFKKQIDHVIAHRTAALLDTLTQLEKSKHELAEALTKEHRLNTLRTQFLTFASHEFRTPLGIIASSAHLLSKYNKMGNTVKQEEHIETILTNVKKLTALLEESLSIGTLQVKNDERPLNFYLSKIMQEMNNTLPE